jgi:hydrogenase maturation protein HypF
MTDSARKIIVSGRVQGVGYRPFVYVTAEKLGLTGSVLNGSGKVFIHVEGPADAIVALERALVHDAPPLARAVLDASRPAEPVGAESFRILPSDAATEPEIHVPPDLFTCNDCLQELTDPKERRHGYPFINCTQCGPRYTLITAMPYDRPNTSMAAFVLCEACRAEYGSPADRRFHAQPLACAECGPELEFVRETGGPGDVAPISLNSQSISHAIRALEQGQIIAVKGVGGYHLVCDAASDAAVARLRARKHRPHKPLAVMFPLRGKDGLDAVRDHLKLDDVAAAALTDPARPIVLVPKGNGSGLSPSLAPGLRELGAFLPYSPLHHQLLAAFGRPLVATSGNISGEPVITDNDEAQQRLGGVADAFLHHNRPIVRPADDPVIRPMAQRPRPIRLGRGTAPLERALPYRLDRPVLATGGHMKNTIALAWDSRVVVSPHVGDLGSPKSNNVYNIIINDISNLYNVKYQAIACDRHPGYASTRWALKQGLPVLKVQHHAAHASSLAGEHPGVESWLVFTWDGVGYGSDGSLWGGEALIGRPGRWNRAASFRPFKLVGGDKAGREPWRSAAALVWSEESNFENGSGSGFSRDIFLRRSTRSRLKPLPLTHQKLLTEADLELSHQAWRRDINVFETSAAGRLFDAAAALVLGRHHASFEGQGPMELEQIAAAGCEALVLPLSEDDRGVLRSDWAPLLEVLGDETLAPERRAGLFHETMARALLDQALAVREKVRFDAVGLSGGVFQNRILTERASGLLTAAGFDVRLHRKIPANDGGLSFGQVIEALCMQD